VNPIAGISGRRFLGQKFDSTLYDATVPQYECSGPDNTVPPVPSGDGRCLSTTLPRASRGYHPGGDVGQTARELVPYLAPPSPEGGALAVPVSADAVPFCDAADF
jgi:hypothetical protein